MPAGAATEEQQSHTRCHVGGVRGTRTEPAGYRRRCAAAVGRLCSVGFPGPPGTGPHALDGAVAAQRPSAASLQCSLRHRRDRRSISVAGLLRSGRSIGSAPPPSSRSSVTAACSTGGQDGPLPRSRSTSCGVLCGHVSGRAPQCFRDHGQLVRAGLEEHPRGPRQGLGAVSAACPPTLHQRALDSQLLEPAVSSHGGGWRLSSDWPLVLHEPGLLPSV